jgi:hypothetical protein
MLISFFSFIVVLGGGTLWHLQRFLQCIKYSILEFTPYTSLLHSPSSIPGTVSTSIIFAFTYMFTYYLHHIHPSVLFPCHLFTGDNPHSQAEAVLLSCSLIL